MQAARQWRRARAHESVPGSLSALVSGRPHPQAAARDRRDIVARRRALPAWRGCDGTRQVAYAWLPAVHRSWSCSEPKAMGVSSRSHAAEQNFDNESVSAVAMTTITMLRGATIG